MPSLKTVRQRRRFGNPNRGGRVKDALDWGRKEREAKERKQAIEITREAEDANIDEIVSRLNAAVESKPTVDLEICDKSSPFTLTSYEDFISHYPDDQSLMRWLVEQLHPSGVACPQCNNLKCFQLRTRPKVWSCGKCRAQVHPTAGTIFHKSSTPIRIWLHVIYLMAARRGEVTALEVQRETRVTYKCAWRICKEVKALSLATVYDLGDAVIGNRRAIGTPNRIWTDDEDEAIRAAWTTSWPKKFVFEMLAKWQGRTVAALTTRAYTLGLRKWTPEQRQAYHTRAAQRRAAIDECLMTGGRRKEIAKQLGVNPCWIAIRHGDLAFAGIAMPPVPWWTSGGQRPAPVWQTIANAAWAEYRDNGPKPLGEKCMCSHRESQHVASICTAVSTKGEVCECPEFVLRGEKREHSNGNVLHRFKLLDDVIRREADIEDPRAARMLAVIAAPPPSDDGEIYECLRDDNDRYVQMGYVSWRLHQAS